jgi:hypothetical protein
VRRRSNSRRFIAALLASAVLAPAAHAATPPAAPSSAVDPAIAMYVEHLPTSAGPVAADQRARKQQTRVEGSGSGTVLLVVALGLLTATFGGTAVRRIRNARD